MAWELNPDRPIYQQAAERIRARIINGAYPQGMMLPEVRELALEAGVNPNTMQRAFQALEESGLICRRGAFGYCVTEDQEFTEHLKYQSARRQTRYFVNQMKELGYQPQQIHLLIDQILKEQG